MTLVADTFGMHPDRIWLYVRKLIRLRWGMFISGIKRAKPLRKVLYLCLALLVIGAFIGIYLLSAYLFRWFNSSELLESGFNLDTFLGSIPALIISGAFAGIMVVSFGILLQALYLANDMEFLLSTPIPVRAVFLTKLTQAILPNFMLVSVICLPVLYGLGVVEGYNIVYFPVVLLLLIFLSLAAAGISSLLVMVVVRFLPAKRVAEILAFLAAVFFMLLSQWSNLTGINSESITYQQVARGTQILSRLNISWSPLAWGGRGLIEIGESHWLVGIFLVVLTVTLSAGLFMLALITAEHLYYSGWASMRVHIQNKKVHRQVRHNFIGNSGGRLFRSLLPPQVLAIMLKDIKLLWRDLRNMSKLIMPLILGIVFAAMLLRGSGGSLIENGVVPPLQVDIFQIVMTYGSMFIPLMVGWMLILNVSLISFSMEGKCFWMIKTSPINANKQLGAKFLVAYLPTLILVCTYMLAIAILQGVSAEILVYCIPTIALILAGVVGINLAFGVRYANLNWSDPRHMSDGIGSYLAMIVSFLYVLICVFLFLAPPIGLPMLGVSEAVGYGVGLLVGCIASVACTILPLASAREKVYQIGEL